MGKLIRSLTGAGRRGKSKSLGRWLGDGGFVGKVEGERFISRRMRNSENRSMILKSLLK